jgi:hypothetical protein
MTTTNTTSPLLPAMAKSIGWPLDSACGMVGETVEHETHLAPAPQSAPPSFHALPTVLPRPLVSNSRLTVTLEDDGIGVKDRDEQFTLVSFDDIARLRIGNGSHGMAIDGSNVGPTLRVWRKRARRPIVFHVATPLSAGRPISGVLPRHWRRGP